jgi:hypothetical protein
MSPCRPVLLGLTLTLALAPAAPALIVEGDALANSVAPSPTDPGWNNVGKRSAYGAVYIGSGWVLTAGHVGAGDVYFGGVLYPWVPGSDYQLTNPDSSPADLVMFHLYPPYPALPALTIASTQPPTNRELILIGHGYTIGDPTSWDPFPGPPPSAIDGYNWAAGVGTRWGKNRVEISSYYELDLDSWVFASVFDEPSGGGITNECQGATGDSGGAVFGWNGVELRARGYLGSDRDLPGPESARADRAVREYDVRHRSLDLSHQDHQPDARADRWTVARGGDRRCARAYAPPDHRSQVAGICTYERSSALTDAQPSRRSVRSTSARRISSARATPASPAAARP